MKSKGNYRFFFSGKQLIMMLAGMALAMVLVFVVGFLISREGDESQRVTIKGQTPSERDTHDKGGSPLKEKRESENDIPDSELTFYDSLIRKEVLSTPPTSSVKTPHRTEKQGNLATQNERGKKVRKKTVDQSMSLNGYTLQVGSFKTEERAKTLLRKLMKKGYQAYTISSNIPMKGTWHRVRVGHFQTLEEARKTRLTIEMKERLPVYVTFISK